jgi:hypothetical protein
MQGMGTIYRDFCYDKVEIGGRSVKLGPAAASASKLITLKHSLQEAS